MKQVIELLGKTVKFVHIQRMVISLKNKERKTLIFRHIFKHFLTYFSDMESVGMSLPFPPCITKGDETFPHSGNVGKGLYS